MFDIRPVFLPSGGRLSLVFRVFSQIPQNTMYSGGERAATIPSTYISAKKTLDALAAQKRGGGNTMQSGVT